MKILKISGIKPHGFFDGTIVPFNTSVIATDVVDNIIIISEEGILYADGRISGSFFKSTPHTNTKAQGLVFDFNSLDELLLFLQNNQSPQFPQTLEIETVDELPPLKRGEISPIKKMIKFFTDTWSFSNGNKFAWIEDSDKFDADWQGRASVRWSCGITEGIYEGLASPVELVGENLEWQPFDGAICHRLIKTNTIKKSNFITPNSKLNPLHGILRHS